MLNECKIYISSILATTSIVSHKHVFAYQSDFD